MGADGANSLVRRSVAQPFPAGRAVDRERLLRPRSERGPESTSPSRVRRPAICGRSRDRITCAIGACGQANETSSAALLESHGGVDSAQHRPGRRHDPLQLADSRRCRRHSCAPNARPAIAGCSSATRPVCVESDHPRGPVLCPRIRGHRREQPAERRSRPLATPARCAAASTPSCGRPPVTRPAFFNSAFSGLLLRALQRDPGIRHVMADLISGRQDVRADCDGGC